MSPVMLEGPKLLMMIYSATVELVEKNGGIDVQVTVHMLFRVWLVLVEFRVQTVTRKRTLTVLCLLRFFFIIVVDMVEVAKNVIMNVYMLIMFVTGWVVVIVVVVDVVVAAASAGMNKAVRVKSL